MALRGIVIELNGGQLSDLFFNFDHPQRDALYRPKDADFTHEELMSAITEDAKEFAAVLGIENEAFVTELADDFQRRV